MVIDQIKEQAKYGKVVVLFDMDGVIAEFGSNEKKFILSNHPEFFLHRRPIKTIINIIEDLNNFENITLGIVSNCFFEEQKQDKITWLKKHLPFLKEENICIIKLNEEKYTKETKDFIKAKYIEKNWKKDDLIYFFEDDHGIIRATQKVFPEIVVNHISTLIY